MQRSDTKILTTHVGSLPGRGESGHETPDADAIREIVAAQQAVGLDIVNEGEFTKGGDWLSFIDGRLGGFTSASATGAPLLFQGKDRETFADFYKYAAERGTLFFVTKDKPAVKRIYWECTGPITYTGHAAMQREIDLFKAALAGGSHGRHLPHHHGACESRALSHEQILQDHGGIPVRLR